MYIAPKMLIYSKKWDEICSALMYLYPNDQKNIARFKMVFGQLQMLTPAESNMRIILEQVFDEFENGWHTCISGKNGTLKKEENLEIFKDDKIGNQEVSYGIEFVGSEKWLVKFLNRIPTQYPVTFHKGYR